MDENRLTKDWKIISSETVIGQCPHCGFSSELKVFQNIGMPTSSDDDPHYFSLVMGCTSCERLFLLEGSLMDYVSKFDMKNEPYPDLESSEFKLKVRLQFTRSIWPTRQYVLYFRELCDLFEPFPRLVVSAGDNSPRLVRIHKYAIEINKCMAIGAHYAAGILCRSILETSLGLGLGGDEKKPSLSEDATRYFEQHKINEHQQHVLEHIRTIGNKLVHSGQKNDETFVEIEEKDIVKFVEMTDRFIRYLFVECQLDRQELSRWKDSVTNSTGIQNNGKATKHG